MSGVKEKYHHGDLRAALLDAAMAVIDEIGVDLITDDQQVPMRSDLGHRLQVVRIVADTRGILG